MPPGRKLDCFSYCALYVFSYNIDMTKHWNINGLVIDFKQLLQKNNSRQDMANRYRILEQ